MSPGLTEISDLEPRFIIIPSLVIKVLIPISPDSPPSSLNKHVIFIYLKHTLTLNKIPVRIENLFCINFQFNLIFLHLKSFFTLLSVRTHKFNISLNKYSLIRPSPPEYFPLPPLFFTLI